MRSSDRDDTGESPRAEAALIENAYAALVAVPREEMEKIGVPSSLICPECNGPLWQMRDGPRRFRCHTGHAFSPNTLIEDHRELTERTLAVLLRLFDDEVNLLEHVRETAQKDRATSDELDRAEAESRRRAALIRTLLPGSLPIGPIS